MDDAVREAVDHNLALVAERYAVSIAEARILTARLRPNPVFTYSAMLPAAGVYDNNVVAPGKIDANPNRVSKVLLPVTGRIASVLVKTGDAVRKGQALLTIDSPDADAAMSANLSAQAAVAQAAAALAKAQADLDRATDLFEHDAIARKDVLTADNALAQAKAARDQTDAAREQAHRRLNVLGLEPGTFPSCDRRSPARCST